MLTLSPMEAEARHKQLQGKFDALLSASLRLAYEIEMLSQAGTKAREALEDFRKLFHAGGALAEPIEGSES